MSLAGTVVGLARNRVMVENAVSLLIGSWLGRALVKDQANNPGRLAAAAGVVALSFDVDFEEDVLALPDLVRFLDYLGLKASFACVGAWVERYPDQHRLLVEAGHEIVNHTQTHPDNEELDPDRHFHHLSPNDLRAQIRRADRIIRDILGVSPRGFRAPHFGYQHTEAVYPLIAELGYEYSSSTIASRCPTLGWPHRTGNRLWEIPVTVCPVHPFSSFDTWHFVRKQPSRHSDGDFTEALGQRLDQAREYDLSLAFYFDPRDSGPGAPCREALELLAGSDLTVLSFAGLVDRLGRGEN